MSAFDPPPETQYTVLSLGAGVQSSALALMAKHGDISGPMPDAAIFADTQAEPDDVYDWLDWLEGELPFPVHRVTKGDLTQKSLEVTKHKKTGADRVNNIIPAFGILPDGTKTAAIGRKCTADYKIQPIHKFIRENFGIKRGQKEVTITQWIGISWDEIQRMKHSQKKYIQHRWPLIEKRYTREHCKQWMKKHGYPEPPRSACYYCPFHSDSEWRRLRDDQPEFFSKAIAFDKDLRKVHKEHNPTLKMEVYLHNSCKPLDEIDFDSDEDKGQMTFDFQSECEGMCGI